MNIFVRRGAVWDSGLDGAIIRGATPGFFQINSTPDEVELAAIVLHKALNAWDVRVTQFLMLASVLVIRGERNA